MIEYDNVFNLVGIDLGPTYFENIAQKIDVPQHYKNIQWRAKLNVKCKQIRYYGSYKSFESSQKSLICSTNFSKQIIKVVDITENEILLFDGCKHGYNAMLVDKYTEEQINKRSPDQILFPDSDSIFEVILEAYYLVDFEDEFLDEVNEQGMIELIDNSLVDFSYLKRNAFDVFGIYISENTGKEYPILEEELA